MKIQDFPNYRAPKNWEQTQIQAYVQPKLQALYHKRLCGATILGILTLMFCYTLIHIEPVTDNLPIIAVESMLLFLCITSALACWFSSKWLHIHQIALQKGEFQVLDCIVHTINDNTDRPSIVKVTIKTEQGQISDESFFLTTNHANLVKEQPNYPFLLMKTLDLAENHVLYELCPKTNIEKGDHITCV